MIKVLIVAAVLVFIANRLLARRRFVDEPEVMPSADSYRRAAPRVDQAQRLAQAADAYRGRRDAQAFTILSHPDTDWATIADAARSCPEWSAQRLAVTLSQPGGHTILIDEIQHATPQRRAWILTTLQACVAVYPVAA